jgi:hypothetical protein
VPRGAIVFLQKRSQLTANGGGAAWNGAQKDIGMRIAAAQWLRGARGLEVFERGPENS